MGSGLLVGRFQPFHLGHLAAVKFALTKVDLLFIAVGSAQKSHEPDNPFTASERITMIKSALEEEAIDCRRWLLIPVPDTRVHSVWVDHVMTLVPRFDVVFSNDKLTLRLFRERATKVVEVPYLRREMYSATQIRAEMLRGNAWQKKVPQAVARIIGELRGVERLRQIAREN